MKSLLYKGAVYKQTSSVLSKGGILITHKFKNIGSGLYTRTLLFLKIQGKRLPKSNRRPPIGSMLAVTETVLDKTGKEFKVFRVENVEVVSKFRGKGYGKMLYKEALKLIFPHWLSQDYAGGTTVDAERVWVSLRKSEDIECRQVEVEGQKISICRNKFEV